jgi:hypothetical protein
MIVAAWTAFGVVTAAVVSMFAVLFKTIRGAGSGVVQVGPSWIRGDHLDRRIDALEARLDARIDMQAFRMDRFATRPHDHLGRPGI